MEPYLFIVRSAENDVLLVEEVEVNTSDNYLCMAYMCKDTANYLYCRRIAQRCEIWTKSDHSHMNLLVTVF